MDTLLDLVPELQRLGKREAVRWSNGLRKWIWTYSDLYAHSMAVAEWLNINGIVKGDRIIIWGENRPEWLAIFWGAIWKGVVVVPVDFRFSADLLQRILRESSAKLLIYGNSVDVTNIKIEHIPFDDISSLSTVQPPVPAQVTAEDVVEIVYTSGTTGEPKGVVHRHRNICSNLEPFRKEILKYRHWAIPFQPVRLLNLLPLSHMFGQSQGLFIPLLLGGSVAFTEEIRPSAIMRFTRAQRISVIVSVPRILETLQSEVKRRFSLANPPAMKGWPGVLLRWWKFRNIHSQFGWKFWSFVVGGAKVDPELEEFWSQLGYLVIQGYGLTEASPVVAVNHPFNARRGSLGKVVPGQDVMIAPDGEIMVRGESVTGNRGEWLSTGDLGEIDGEGRLYYRGRKKDMIVTPEGLNVHPEDVEAVLNASPHVRDSAVVGNDQVHAVLILSNGLTDPASIVSQANERLEAHQRIRAWTIWPDAEFPRTASTMKLKRHEVARRIASGAPTPSAPAPKSALDELLQRRPDARLAEDLGISSLERVELLSEMEGRYGVELDESAFAQVKTVGELKQIGTVTQADRVSTTRFQNWPASFPIRLLRTLLQHGLALPLFRHYIPLTVNGLEHLGTVAGPVIFAANHTSHLDTIAIVAALPEEWRRRLAPAMSKDYFRDWFEGRSWKTGLQYLLARIAFNTYPLPQEMAGVKGALLYTGELVGMNYCPLVYPEGRRTADGAIHAFRPGIGLMAVRLQVPVIPVNIAGLYEVYSMHHDWPKAGPVRVTFGQPIKFASNTPFQAAADAIHAAVSESKNRRS